AHASLGWVLRLQEKLAEAEAWLRKAVGLDPKHAGAHNELGIVLRGRSKWAEAEQAFRKAIEVAPNFRPAPFNLGPLLEQQSRWAEALALYRKYLEREPWRAWARARLPRAERMAALQEKLPAFLEGAFRPRSSDERLALAYMCMRSRCY